jgi:hypothetical protein
VEVVSGIEPSDSQFIRVDAESYSVRSNTLNTILTKKFNIFAKTK